MKNIRFNQVGVGNCNYLRTNVRENDIVNEKVVDMVFESSDLHILPITYSEYEQVMEVLLEDYITLDDVFKNDITKEELLTIFFNLIKEISGLVRKGIKLEYLVLNKRYIYLNPEDSTVRFICIPIDNVEHQVDFKIFLRSLLVTAKFDSTEPLEYVGRLINCINGDDYTNTKLVALMRNLGGENLGKSIRYKDLPTKLGDARGLDSAVDEITEVNMFDANIEDEVLANEFAKVRQEKVLPVAPVVAVMPEGLGTKAYIVRLATKEKTLIKKERFNIGKSDVGNDLIVPNEKVSRYHCAIVCRDGKYYIKDNGSTNKTFVNGIDIGDRAVELENNTKVNLGTEEFIFIIS